MFQTRQRLRKSEVIRKSNDQITKGILVCDGNRVFRKFYLIYFRKVLSLVLFSLVLLQTLLMVGVANIHLLLLILLKLVFLLFPKFGDVGSLVQLVQL